MNRWVDGSNPDELFDLIAGRGKWLGMGLGFHTYPDLSDREMRLHEACLALQRQGRINGVEAAPGHWEWKVVNE